jgi:hypothetical protein
VKVVFASTPDQEEKIKELIQYFYTDIFPLYFSDEEIMGFKQLNVLHTSASTFEDCGTLKDAYQVITCLQTLCHILERNHLDSKYDSLFQKNVDTLTDFGLSFPFRYGNFMDMRNLKAENLSIYTKADNEMLI